MGFELISIAFQVLINTKRCVIANCKQLVFIGNNGRRRDDDEWYRWTIPAKACRDWIVANELRNGTNINGINFPLSIQCDSIESPPERPIDLCAHTRVLFIWYQLPFWIDRASFLSFTHLLHSNLAHVAMVVMHKRAHKQKYWYREQMDLNNNKTLRYAMV